MNTFDITRWDDGGVRVVRVTGEFDLSACPEFRLAHAAEPDAAHDFVVIDLRQATFLDSHALGELIALHTRAQAEHFTLAVIRPEGYADRIFKITGADGHLPLYDERVPILAQMNYG